LLKNIKKLIINELKFNFESLKKHPPALFLSPLFIVIIDILHIIKTFWTKEIKNKKSTKHRYQEVLILVYARRQEIIPKMLYQVH